MADSQKVCSILSSVYELTTKDAKKYSCVVRRDGACLHKRLDTSLEGAVTQLDTWTIYAYNNQMRVMSGLRLQDPDRWDLSAVATAVFHSFPGGRSGGRVVNRLVTRSNVWKHSG